LAGFTYFTDWHTTGNQIITFRNLYDNDEELGNFVDKGTITVIKSQEYWSTGED